MDHIPSNIHHGDLELDPIYNSLALLLVNVAIGSASIVEPQGFSGSLPVMFSMCCKLCDFIQANKDVLFCSVPTHVCLGPCESTTKAGS